MKCSNPTVYGACRKCEACLNNRVRQWQLRLILEAMLYDSDQTTFLTLTYKPECLPASEDDAKDQLQKWLKRLRKNLNSESHIRYVAALEQGSNSTKRYHWHCILYGLRFTAVNKHFLSKCWGLGFIDWKPATHGRMSYVLKYVIKGGKFLMSRRPGIGAGMLEALDKMISGLSVAEVSKLRNNADRQLLLKKFFISHSRITGRESVAHKPGGAFLKESRTVTALRVGGFYFPLHRYLKERLVDMREFYGSSKK